MSANQNQKQTPADPPTEPVRTQKDPPLEPKAPPMTEPPADEPRSDDPPDNEPVGEHEGATETEVGDRTGPGAGFDNEPEKIKDRGGVVPS